MSERSSHPSESPQVEPQAEARMDPPAVDTAGDEAHLGQARARSGAEGAGRTFELSDDPFPLTGSDDEGDDRGRTPQRSSRTKRIVLAGLLAIGVAGAAVIGTSAVRIVNQKDASLVAPPEVGTLRIDRSENGLQTADYLSTALSADVDLDRSIGAVYTDGGTSERGVLFFGGTTLIWTPEADLDTAFNLIADDQGAVTGLHDVDAGELGGTMKCGATESPEGDISVCGWADHGSLALAMFPNRTEDESAQLLLDIRNAAQTRE